MKNGGKESDASSLWGNRVKLAVHGIAVLLEVPAAARCSNAPPPPPLKNGFGGTRDSSGSDDLQLVGLPRKGGICQSGDNLLVAPMLTRIFWMSPGAT